MTVLYYTQTYYLDAVIETIKSLQGTDIKIHMIIEVTPDSKCSNIIQINNLNEANSISDFYLLIGKHKAVAFEPYFKNLISVQFLVFKKSSVFNLNTLLTITRFMKWLYKIKPNVVHFDTITFRSLLLSPFFSHLKKIITIHDPLPHVGEESWKSSLTKWIYFKLAQNFVFYSNYAKNQFETHYLDYKKPKYLIQFQPFSFNQQYMHRDKTASCILFFGRISYYKGIDLLIQAIPEILKSYPQQLFVIAGKSDGFKLDYQFFKKYEHNILLLNRYIKPNEAVHLMQKSKFLICPYRDASQSGVLMTAHAIGKSVIATRVGAFPEYIQDDVTGLIAEPTIESIVEKILYCLDNKRFKIYETNIIKNFSQSVALSNRKILMKSYLSN